MSGPVPMSQQQQQMMHQQMVAQQQMQMNSPHPPPPGAIPVHPNQQQQIPPGASVGPPMHPHPPSQHHQPPERMDNISKAKALVSPIKDTLSNVLRTAASAIYANNMVDSGSKPVDFDVNKFDRTLEEFFTLCDQMEVHLKTSIECINQGMCSQRYLQTPVSLSRVDGNITYPQYINVVKAQISYAKEVHGSLSEYVRKLNE